MNLPPRRSGSQNAPRQRVAWLTAPLFLLAIAVGVTFVRQGPSLAFGLTLTALFAIVFLWIGVSVFFPAQADKRCPSCGADGLERLDPNTTRGLRCALCGFTDESASSFYLAEAEGPLEHAVLSERRLKRKRGRRARPLVRP